MSDHRYRFVILLTGALMLLSTACVYQNEETLYPEEIQEEPVETDTCGIPDVVSYETDVLPLLEKHYCIACHEASDPAGGIVLEGYGNVEPYARNGSLVGSIAHEPGYSAMPDVYPKMPDCEIEMVRAWVEQGFVNN